MNCTTLARSAGSVIAFVSVARTQSLVLTGRNYMIRRHERAPRAPLVRNYLDQNQNPAPRMTLERSSSYPFALSRLMRYPSWAKIGRRSHV